jgi:Domain of unknown function (DUF1854)
MSENGKGSHSTSNGHKPKASAQLPAAFGLVRDEWGQLVFTGTGGERHTNVSPIALFPISEPERWISIRAAGGAELACIEDPSTLPADVWKLLKEELARREFVPIIHRIVRVSGNSEPCEWQVETDRGPTSFVLQSEDDVRRIGDQQIVILDAHGTRYHIPDLSAVDVKSRRIVEWYV